MKRMDGLIINLQAKGKMMKSGRRKENFEAQTIIRIIHEDMLLYNKFKTVNLLL